MKLPVQVPKGFKAIMTQGYFKDTHEAIDFVVWNPLATYKENQRLSYGANLVCPFKEAVCTQSEFFPDGMWEFKDGQKIKGQPGGWVDIQGFYEGVKYDLHFQHNSKNLIKVGDKVKEGDIVAQMGNYGPCRPMPTPEEPFNGTHTHLSMWKLEDGKNAVNVNVLDFVDTTSWYSGNQTSGAEDAQAINWAFERLGIKSNFEKLLWVFRNIFG
jgi:hypothetical protein